MNIRVLPSLLPIATAFMAGICAAHCSIHIWWLCGLSVLLTRQLRDLTFTVVAFCCAATLAQKQVARINDYFVAHGKGQMVSMRGVVTDVEQEMMHLHVPEGIVQLRIPQRLQQNQRMPEIGDTVSIDVVRLRTPYLWQLMRKGSIASGSISSKATVQIHSHPTWSIRRTLIGARNQLARRIQALLSAQTGSLFATIFLGNTKDSPHYDEQRSLFSNWGIVHQLARSGLHLVLFLLLIRWLLGLFALTRATKTAIQLIIIAIYAALSWSSISFTRACVTCVIYALYDLFYIPITALEGIIVVTLLILAENPAQLFFLDFQLSFGLTFALAFLGHVHSRRKVLLAQEQAI